MKRELNLGGKAMAKQEPRRGGTDGGRPERMMDVGAMSEGTAAQGAPSGGVHNEAPSRQVPRTDLDARDDRPPRLAGGKSASDVLRLLGGLEFPAKKDAVVRAARRNGAPDDVLGALNLLTATEYADEQALLRDYPRLDNDDPGSSGPSAGKRPPTR
jgi:hypothetical protein